MVEEIASTPTDELFDAFALIAAFERKLQESMLLPFAYLCDGPMQQLSWPIERTRPMYNPDGSLAFEYLEPKATYSPSTRIRLDGA